MTHRTRRSPETRATVRAVDVSNDVAMTHNTLLDSGLSYHNQLSDRGSETQKPESPGNPGRFSWRRPWTPSMTSSWLRAR